MKRYNSESNSEQRSPNPRITANVFEIITFSWMLNLFKTGKKRDLDENDLYTTLKDHTASSLGYKLEEKWSLEMVDAKNKNRKPSLLRALFQTFGAEYMFYGFLQAIDVNCLKLSYPLLFGGFLSYFNPEDSKKVDEKYAYKCAFGLLLTHLISIALFHFVQMEISHCGMKARVACCSIIYKKALKLSHKAFGKTTNGQVINLISNDVSRFDLPPIFIHYIWIGPLQTIIVTYLLWQEIGVSSLFGIVLLIFFIPFQGWLGKKIGNLRQKMASRTDERLRLINEIISGIQVIKMYAWEKPFSKLLRSARKREITVIKGSSFIKAILISIIIVQTKLQLFASILAYVLAGNYMTAQKIFVVIALYNILISSMTVYFSQSMGHMAELLVSLRRIQKFLLLEEKDSLTSKLSESFQKTISCDSKLNNDNVIKTRNDMTTDVKNFNDLDVEISHVTAKWTDDQTTNTLENINLTVQCGRLVAIIGPVGSGKSSLMQLILRELPLSEGNIKTRGIVSYASQQPWLFSGSIEQNILFDSPKDEERYKKVIQVCALKSDFEQLPHGDKTIVGEKGVTLSGGQRARISLARAVYKKADIYLLDDPLSAVDTRVGNHLFEKCIKDYLKEKTCILITHQLQFLTKVDQIVLIDNLYNYDEFSWTVLFLIVIYLFIINQEIRGGDIINIELNEMSRAGVMDFYILANIVAEGSYNEIQTSGYDIAKLIRSLEETTIESEIEVIDQNNEKLSRKQSLPLKGPNGNNSSSFTERKLNEIKERPVVAAESRSSGRISNNVLISYFSAVGSTCKVIMFFLTFIFTQVWVTGVELWLNFWLHQEETIFSNINSSLDGSPVNMTCEVSDTLSLTLICRQTYEIVYAALVMFLLIACLIRSLAFAYVMTEASSNLHSRLFNAIIRATMYFFNTNSSGRILNRFSNDIGVIDGVLPSILLEVLQILMLILGIFFVVAFVNMYLLIPTTMFVLVLYKLRNFFLRTSQSIKRLEGVTRSPVLSHMNESLHGLTTIRAYTADKVVSEEFDCHQDLHSSTWYLFISSNDAFGFWLDFIGWIYISIIIFSFLLINNDTYGGNVGLVISQIMTLTEMAQWGIRQTTIFENQITSVERVLEYTNCPQEPNDESSTVKIPAKEWPDSGRITFQNFHLRYSPSAPYVLKNLNFQIQPMEKIGIVGRTGAGKSSIISALFRLALNEGNISIDDIEIHELSLDHLRSKLSIIPQDPFLFCGTMRKNLDPFDEYPDNDLWNAIEEVKLKDVIANLPGGLNSSISENGSNLSVGQRQLVCLARAIVRNRKILILDEATANVDPQTDALIQTTIRNKFRMCTVLTIAHRLNTVIDSDRILVMDEGSMVEFGHPYSLLQNKDGFLYSMVKQSGHATADMLHKVAADNFKGIQTRK